VPSQPSFVTHAALILALVAGSLTPALAQQPSAQPAASQNQVLTSDAKREFDENTKLLKDYIHYIYINRPDVAAGKMKQLLNKNLKPTEFVDIVEKSGEGARFDAANARGMKDAQLEPVAAETVRLFEKGKLERVRNPDEIKRSIQMLTGVQRGRILARERLASAGEYALPQLLESLLKLDPEVRAQVTTLLIDMGQQSVGPLCAALLQLDPSSQETVVSILAKNGYKSSLPYLLDLAKSTQSPNVRSACERAISQLGGSLGTEPANAYTELGEGYYDRRAELTSFPGEQYQLYWTYNPGSGLVMTALRTEVYFEAMAMHLSERSLALRPAGNDRGLSLWLAANFSRELNTPKDYENPVYPKDRREAMYYAVAAGAGSSQQVLERAITRRDSRVARRAIEAIEQTASGPALFGAVSTGTRPLVEALQFPSRRVQYDAALAISKAAPTQTFAGAERVVPLLGSAIRDAGTRFAIVLSDNREIADTTRKTLEHAGYTVLPVGTTLADVAPAIADAPGIDLIVSTLPPDPTSALINEVRASAKMSVTPVLAITSPQAAIDLARRYDRTPSVAVRPSGVSQEQITKAAEQLVEAASGGPISVDEAKVYASRSLMALRDLAIAQSPVLNPNDAALPLISSLTDEKGPPKLAVAEVLAYLGQKRAQVALMDAALNAKPGDRVPLLVKVAESAKRFGNLLEPRQVDRALEMANTATGAEGTAAAALVGSLNLQSNSIVPLILGTGGKK
jgi:HEAT repeat protein